MRYKNIKQKVAFTDNDGIGQPIDPALLRSVRVL